MLGCVRDIWVLESGSTAYITLYAYEWLHDDETMKMPSVRLREDTVTSLATVSFIQNNRI